MPFPVKTPADMRCWPCPSCLGQRDSRHVHTLGRQWSGRALHPHPSLPGGWARGQDGAWPGAWWALSGRAVCVRSMNGALAFVDTSDCTVMNIAEHYMASDVEWDPTGRYVVTSVSWWSHKVRGPGALRDQVGRASAAPHLGQGPGVALPPASSPGAGIAVDAPGLPRNTAPLELGRGCPPEMPRVENAWLSLACLKLPRGPSLASRCIFPVRSHVPAPETVWRVPSGRICSRGTFGVLVLNFLKRSSSLFPEDDTRVCQ